MSRGLLAATALAALTMAVGCGGSQSGKLSSITVSTSTPIIGLNQMAQFTATLNYDKGKGPSTKPAIVWSSSNTNIATIDMNGRALAKAAGETNIIARAGGKMGMAVLKVSAEKVLTAVQITPAAPRVPVRRAVGLTATGIYSDGTNANLTATAEWTSSVPANATVTNMGAKGLVVGVKAGTTRITAKVTTAAGTFMGETDVTVTEPKLNAITVDPPTATIARMSTRAFKATATYDDNTILDVTGAVNWTSSMTTVATISNTDGSRGVASGVAAGTTTITATLEDKSGTATLTVSGMAPSSVVVTPANPSLGLGATQQFTATATFPDNSTQNVTNDAVWTSSMMAIATVDAMGRVTAVAMGTSTITASFGGQMGSTTLTVTNATPMTITVSPTGATRARGTTQQYTASARYTDNSMRDVTTEVTWGSTNLMVATVSNADGSKGLVTAANAGETMITASLGGALGSTSLTVTGAMLTAIAITPQNPTIANTTSVGFTARGLFSDGTNQDLTSEVAWQSSNAAVATISNADGTEGVATGVGAGFVDITASMGTVTATTRLTITTATLTGISVTPPLPRLAQGTSQQLRATGTFSDGTVQDLTSSASWTSTATAVATVSGAGRATAVAPGTATIRAAIGMVSGTATVTVTNATLTSINVTPANPTIARDTTVDLTASGLFNDGTNQDLTDQVTWESAAAAVATVASGGATPGRVRGNTAGTAMITARFGTVSGSTTVTVTNAVLMSIAVAPAAVTIAKTTITQLTATGTFVEGTTMTTQNLTTNVFWSTSAGAIATVSNGLGSEGQVTGVAAGMATITARLLTVTGTSTVTVTNAVITSLAVTPTNPTVVRGTTQQFTATGTFTEGMTVTTQNLNLQAVWTSSMTGVAEISNAAGSRGLATGITPGMTTITGAFGGVNGTTVLTVSNALVSIAISPGAPSVVAGSTVQLTLTGVFQDGNNSNLTEDATWSSNNANASVSTAMGTRGLVTGMTAGTSIITATVGGMTTMVTVTVTASPLMSITLSPLNATLPLGTSQQYTATGNYMNGSSADITGDVTWDSSAVVVATVSNAMGTAGRVNTVATGMTIISATLGGVSATTILTVSAATLASISINPTPIKIARTTKLQLQAMGVFTDSSMVDITTAVTWGTGNMATATVSNAGGEQGQVLGVAAGTTMVTATSGMIVGTAPIQVTNAIITSMSVTPANAMVPAGFSQDYTATGTFVDSTVMPAETTTQNLNLQATWGSTSGAVASISNAVGTRGRAQALTNGTTSISAVFNGVAGATNLTVTAALLQAISVSPNPRIIAKGTTQQFTATGIFSDNTTSDITNSVTWSSNNAAAATVIAGPGGMNPGVATGVANGAAGIVATLSGISGTGQLIVSNATIQSLVVRGAPPAAMMDPAVSIAAGTQHQFYAVGTFSDATQQDLTSQITWASSNLALASIDSSGIATGVSPGMPSITAIFLDRTNNMTLAASRAMTVTGATLVSIAITPPTPSVALGQTVALTATGTFSDGTTQNITGTSSWVSGTPANATITNDPMMPGVRGRATGATAGSTVITVTNGSVSSMVTLTVTAATLQMIVVTPPNATIANLATQQYTATAVYSDGTMSVLNMDPGLTWASSNSASAGIDATGLATATATDGATTISAFFGGQIGTTMLTVN